MFERFAPQTRSSAEILRLEALVRARFSVPMDELVLVSENRGGKAGFPEHETNIIFWKREARFKLKIFKRLGAVDASDLPVFWLLPFYEDNGDLDCC